MMSQSLPSMLMTSPISASGPLRKRNLSGRFGRRRTTSKAGTVGPLLSFEGDREVSADSLSEHMPLLAKMFHPLAGASPARKTRVQPSLGLCLRDELDASEDGAPRLLCILRDALPVNRQQQFVAVLGGVGNSLRSSLPWELGAAVPAPVRVAHRELAERLEPHSRMMPRLPRTDVKTGYIVSSYQPPRAALRPLGRTESRRPSAKTPALASPGVWLRRVLAGAAQASTYEEQRHTTDDEQRKVETCEGKAALARCSMQCSLIDLVLDLTGVTAVPLTRRPARTCTERSRGQREHREDR